MYKYLQIIRAYEVSIVLHETIASESNIFYDVPKKITKSEYFYRHTHRWLKRGNKWSKQRLRSASWVYHYLLPCSCNYKA